MECRFLAFAIGIAVAYVIRMVARERHLHWRQLAVFVEICLLTCVAFMPQDMNRWQIALRRWRVNSGAGVQEIAWACLCHNHVYRKSPERYARSCRISIRIIEHVESLCSILERFSALLRSRYREPFDPHDGALHDSYQPRVPYRRDFGHVYRPGATTTARQGGFEAKDRRRSEYAKGFAAGRAYEQANTSSLQEHADVIVAISCAAVARLLVGPPARLSTRNTSLSIRLECPLEYSSEMLLSNRLVVVFTTVCL